MPDIRSVMKAIVADKFDKDESDITDDMSFSNDLGADSLDYVEFIVELEKHFNIVILDDEADKIVTVGDAIAYVVGKTTQSKEISELSYKD